MHSSVIDVRRDCLNSRSIASGRIALSLLFVSDVVCKSQCPDVQEWLSYELTLNTSLNSCRLHAPDRLFNGDTSEVWIR
jgi:hypothetical protein